MSTAFAEPDMLYDEKVVEMKNRKQKCGACDNIFWPEDLVRWVFGLGKVFNLLYNQSSSVDSRSGVSKMSQLQTGSRAVGGPAV